MRKSTILILFLFATLASCPINPLQADNTPEKPNKAWSERRFSMFIHWGLYSQLGGVWNNKPVEQGYSEQIQSFAGIFSDYYAATARTFKGEKWNADSIAALAKAAHMQSIVMTAKHHDGFSMYPTRYSKYNITDATPFGRDPLMELSKACEKAGLKFGIYFSLIDWNFPQAYPISSHNADPVTPEHHAHNLNQVRELLTNYGPISEVWFDMGALTREQSKELYDLVTGLQPGCMVSGRLGNDFGDFAVMADNACPDYPIGIPWQTAGSVFKETWGYRSWQKRDDLPGKIAEKIRTLKNVVRHGGNYLLNIGPRGDGSVVEFERDLLLAMGNWLQDSSKVLYAENNLNRETPGTKKAPVRTFLDYSNAAPVFGYSGFDYYSSFRSIIGYTWHFTSRKTVPYLQYHAGDAGKTLLFTLNGRTYPVKLEGGEPLAQTPAPTKISRTFILEKGRSSFGEQFIAPDALAALSGGIYTKTDLKEAEDAGWKLIPAVHASAGTFGYEGPVQWKQNIWLAHVLEAEDATSLLVRFGGKENTGAADALEIWLNGKQLFKRGYTNIRPEPEYLNLSLNKGQNLLVVKLHNRFNDRIDYQFTTTVPQQQFKLQLPFRLPSGNRPDTLSVRLQGQKGGADMGLRDIRITFQ